MHSACVSSLSLYQCILAVGAGAWKAFRTLAHRGRDPMSNKHSHTHTQSDAHKHKHTQLLIIQGHYRPLTIPRKSVVYISAPYSLYNTLQSASLRAWEWWQRRGRMRQKWEVKPPFYCVHRVYRGGSDCGFYLKIYFWLFIFFNRLSMALLWSSNQSPADTLMPTATTAHRRDTLAM